MKYSRAAVPLLALGLALTLPTVAPATDELVGHVMVNGTSLPYAVSFIDATVEVVEFRDGSNPNVVKLIPGAKRYTVCIASRVPVRVFDEELPVADTPDRFTVRVEDGRELSGCVLAGLKQAERPVERTRERRIGSLYRYCLRCEDVTLPAF